MWRTACFLCPSGGENIKKVKEKPLGSKSAKEKVWAAPKELLRRGLLTGTEKLKGQLRDAAEGGRQKDTEADRTQDTAQMGARLAVDRLGRLVLGKKKVRNWSEEAVPGDTPQADPDAPASGAPSELTAPPGDAGPVQIKTREAVHDAPGVGYSRADLPGMEQPLVKTKDAYTHRQAVDRGQVKRQAESASQFGPAQPMVRTKDSCTCRYEVGSDRPRLEVEPRQISEQLTSVPAQAQERGRQRFVRERVCQTATKRAAGRSMEDIAPTPSIRRNVVDGFPRGAPSESVRTAESSSGKAVWENRADGNRPVKAVRSEKTPVGKSKRRKVKTAVDFPERTTKAADRSTGAAQQTVRAAVQPRQRAMRTADEARRAAATVNRPVAKAATSALRGAVSAIRAAMAPLAAGGGAVLAVILVLCLVAALVMSPLGIFFGGGDGGGQTMADAVREINQEYSARLEELKSGSTYDQLSMTGTRAPWPEVMAVYAVKTTSDPTNGQEVVAMTDEKKELLKQVFWDMNELSSFTSTVPGEGDEENITTLHITVSVKTADEMADVYGFNASRRQQLTELLSEEFRELWNAVLYGIGTGSGEIVTVALSQVGNVGGQPYWSWYGFPSRVEWCACFVSWCANECGYIDAGMVPKFAGCVQGSRWFKEQGLWCDKSFTPNPGDVIFFDWDAPGGFSGPQDGIPDHVGIVERVENGRVYTIEGNSGDKCCQRSYPVGYYEIYGYGLFSN